MKLPARSDVAVLVPAAGRGERLGLGPKAALSLGGRPILDWVADKALQLADEVVIACPSGVVVPPGCIGIEGGATRQESVLRLVRATRRPWVVLWDAARPFGSVALARAVLEAAQGGGAAGAFAPSEVPVARIEGGRVTHSFPAAGTGLFQTPQAFAQALLLAAAERADREGMVVQSTLELVLAAGHEVVAVPGEKLNIKLTTADDLRLAQALLGLLA
jgi:2-C-methyl-D-erythritol 4-phosphate cytidylyltransferase